MRGGGGGAAVRKGGDQPPRGWRGCGWVCGGGGDYVGVGAACGTRPTRVVTPTDTRASVRAGCLPSLATIPIFIGLFRSFSNFASSGELAGRGGCCWAGRRGGERSAARWHGRWVGGWVHPPCTHTHTHTHRSPPRESPLLPPPGFYWIPSLAGPTTMAAQRAGNATAWLFPLVDGAPPIGWDEACELRGGVGCGGRVFVVVVGVGRGGEGGVTGERPREGARRMLAVCDRTRRAPPAPPCPPARYLALPLALVIAQVGGVGGVRVVATSPPAAEGECGQAHRPPAPCSPCPPTRLPPPHPTPPSVHLLRDHLPPHRPQPRLRLCKGHQGHRGVSLWGGWLREWRSKEGKGTAWCCLPAATGAQAASPPPRCRPRPLTAPPTPCTPPHAPHSLLPLMVGWFSLNVPSGLSLYYFSNTVLTSAQQVFLRKLGGERARQAVQRPCRCCWPCCCCTCPTVCAAGVCARARARAWGGAGCKGLRAYVARWLVHAEARHALARPPTPLPPSHPLIPPQAPAPASMTLGRSRWARRAAPARPPQACLRATPRMAPAARPPPLALCPPRPATAPPLHWRSPTARTRASRQARASPPQLLQLQRRSPTSIAAASASAASCWPPPAAAVPREQRARPLPPHPARV